MHHRQSSELRRLEKVLLAASEREDEKTQSGRILLESMKLEVFPENLNQFNGLFYKATLEAESLQGNSEVNEDIKVIYGLNRFFAMHNVWTEPWITFKNEIERKNIRSVIRSLAKDFNTENPTIFSEQDFLEELKITFSILLGEIINSELSKDLKSVLKQQIGEILTEIYRYDIHGKEGLEKTAKSMIASLILSEGIWDEKDKKNPFYRKTVSTVLALIITIKPVGSFVMQIAPDFDNFWRPSAEFFLERCSDFTAAINGVESIQEAFKKASITSTEKTQERLPSSSERPLLPGNVEEGNSQDKKS
jgi:hypothetical protein